MELTQKDCPWKAGDLPEKALKAFRELQGALSTGPVLAYPRSSRQSALTSDASVGEVDEQGNRQAIGYASRKLTDFEKNNSVPSRDEGCPMGN